MFRLFEQQKQSREGRFSKPRSHEPCSSLAKPSFVLHVSALAPRQSGLALNGVGIALEALSPILLGSPSFALACGAIPTATQPPNSLDPRGARSKLEQHFLSPHLSSLFANAHQQQKKRCIGIVLSTAPTKRKNTRSIVPY